jgi:hypothetical protein
MHPHPGAMGLPHVALPTEANGKTEGRIGDSYVICVDTV